MKLIRKLQSKKGESVSESLTAIMICALAVSLLSSVIVSSANTLKRKQSAVNHNQQIVDKYFNNQFKKDEIISEMDLQFAEFSLRGTMHEIEIETNEKVYVFK